MRQIVFRTLATFLGCGLLYFAFFGDGSVVQSSGVVYRNIFFGCLMLLYGFGGEHLLSLIPFLKRYVKTRND